MKTGRALQLGGWAHALWQTAAEQTARMYKRNPKAASSETPDPVRRPYKTILDSSVWDLSAAKRDEVQSVGPIQYYA